MKSAKHDPDYRHAVVRAVSGTCCALRVVASENRRLSGLPCKCGGELFSDQGGCVSLVVLP